MNKAQKDTILIDLFNYEDNHLDIAVFYRSKDSLAIYRNEGNGYLSFYRGVSTKGKDVSGISVIKPDSSILPSQGKRGIRINYTDGSRKDYLPKDITDNFLKDDRPIVPYNNILDDGRVFLYDISFIEQWRSMPVGNPIYYCTVGDIDRDGKNEVVYTFSITSTSLPSRIVIFENVSQNQYRIDWDTLLSKGGITLGYPLFDFDRDGNKEFWAYIFFKTFNDYYVGLYECYGEGKYKFRASNVRRTMFALDFKDSIVINGVSKPGFWELDSDPSGESGATLFKHRFNMKTNLGYATDYLVENVRQNYFIYNMVAEDFDQDGREEIMIGDAQWYSYNIAYLDSTGVGTNRGYELKVMDFAEPLSAGYLVSNDMDGDGTKEFITCGIGHYSGCIGVIKHTGAPGTNQWTPMWWDTAGIRAMPNVSVDTGRINGRYTLLYPTVDYGYGYPKPYPILHLLAYTRNGVYTFYRSMKQVQDSTAFIGPTMFDIDKDGKMNILTPLGYEGIVSKAQIFLCDYEQLGTIGINPINTQVADKYELKQNYPNPFNPTTKIKFEIPKSGIVILKIYDITGKEIQTLVDEKLKPGKYESTFDGSKLSSGVYFYQIIAGDYKETKKMLMIK